MVNKSAKSYIIVSIILLVLVLSIVVFVLADAELNNSKTYNETEKTITIKNSSGDEISKITLLTPQSVRIEIKKGVTEYKVAEIEVNLSAKDYQNALEKIEFYDYSDFQKKGNKSTKMNREFTYKKRVFVKQIEVDDYEYVCEDKELGNESIKTICFNNKTGFHFENVYDWINSNSNPSLDKGSIVYGIFTNVKSGEHIEWIPTFFGVEIPEWADFLGYTLFANSTTHDNFMGVAKDQWQSQGFIIGYLEAQGPMELEGISLPISKENTVGDIEVRIFAVDSNNKPTGSALSENSTIDISGWTVSDPNVWENISMPSVVLQNATNYTIVVNTSNVETTGRLRWEYNGSTNDGFPYVHGRVFTSSDEGVSWGVWGSDADAGFKVYGTPVFSPNVTINTPLNKTYDNESIDFNITALNERGIDSCWVTIDGGVSNLTLLNTTTNDDYNATNSSVPDEGYLAEFYCNNTDNIINNTESVDFSVDTIFPNINITYPPNNTNTTDVDIYVNYTVSDINLDSCWYSNDSLDSNTSINCGTNITTITWIEGQHNVTIYANDSANNQNSSLITFTIDTTPPNIIIAHPVALASYSNNNTIPLNYTITDALTEISNCWFNITNSSEDLLVSNTSTGCLNLTFGLPAGDIDYTLFLYANDTLNNLNSTINVSFSVRTDVPTVTLNAPSDNSYLNNGNNTYFNFTATDLDGLDTCELWTNHTGAWHNNYTWISPTNATMNWTTQNISEGGPYEWNIWCNDTLNNPSWALNNFTLIIDETNPSLIFITANETTVTGYSIDIYYNISDTKIDKCYFSLRTSGGLIHNYAENTSTTCGNTSRSITTLSYGTFTFQLWGEDLADNLNNSILTFTTQSTPAPAPPGGGGYETPAEPEPERTFCGDLICQAEGNDYGLIENYWNCNIDCLGFDLDALIYALFPYCFDGDPDTLCFWTQGFGIEEIEPGEEVIWDGKINMETLFSNCLDDDPKTGCFWQTTMAIYVLFGGFGLILALSFVKIRVSGERRKVSGLGYIKIKYKKARRKWRR